MKLSSAFVLVVLLLVVSSGRVSAQEVRKGVLRTPDARFEGLPGFNFKPHYFEVSGYRMHYLDEGPSNGQVVFLLHGEPTWSFLYRKMIPVLARAGYRCIVPDLIGFGRSDKPVDRSIHTYQFHVSTVTSLVKGLKLRNATFFGQDWGGLIGLRVVAENQELFSRIIISNTGLPTGDEILPDAFKAWKKMSQAMLDKGDIEVGLLVSGQIGDPQLRAAYDAPFPDPSYKAGPLILPQLVPASPQDPAHDANRKAWEVFKKWDKPFLTAFGDKDPITGGGDKRFREEVPGAKHNMHKTVSGGKHFIQESNGEELAKIIDEFIRATSAASK